MNSKKKESKPIYGQTTEWITVNNEKIYLHFEPQMSPNGRLFRWSGLGKNLQMPQIWVDGVLKNHWIYTFVYLDENGGFFGFEMNYENKIIKKV